MVPWQCNLVKNGSKIPTKKGPVLHIWGLIIEQYGFSHYFTTKVMRLDRTNTFCGISYTVSKTYKISWGGKWVLRDERVFMNVQFWIEIEVFKLINQSETWKPRLLQASYPFSNVEGLNSPWSTWSFGSTRWLCETQRSLGIPYQSENQNLKQKHETHRANLKDFQSSLQKTFERKQETNEE